MAEMDDVLAELRHCIMGQLKPAQPQHQETSAMTQPVNIEQRRGSAAIAPSAAVANRQAPAPINSAIAWSASLFGSLTWSFVTDEATRRRVDPGPCKRPGSTRDMPAALCGRCWSSPRWPVLDTVTLRAAVVSGRETRPATNGRPPPARRGPDTNPM